MTIDRQTSLHVVSTIKYASSALLASLLLALPVCLPAADLDNDLQRFLSWFPGEYDNNEQVWQEDIDRTEHRHERLHHIFIPVTADAIGEHIFFVQQYLDGDPENIYRQRLYRFTKDADEQALRLDIYSFKDEVRYRDSHLEPARLAELARDELIERPGCEVYWKFNGEFFQGYMREKACSFTSQRSGQEIYVTDDLRLTPEEIWIRDEAFDAEGNRVFGNPDKIHHKNRKVRYFKGWAGVKKAGPTAAKDDENWFSAGEIVIHDEGHIYPILDEDGQPSGWSIELARLTQQSTETEVLKLGLIEDSSGYTVAYSWANPGAERIGINLRWAQIGLHLKPEVPRFGF